MIYYEVLYKLRPNKLRGGGKAKIKQRDRQGRKERKKENLTERKDRNKTKGGMRKRSRGKEENDGNNWKKGKKTKQKSKMGIEKGRIAKTKKNKLKTQNGNGETPHPKLPQRNNQRTKEENPHRKTKNAPMENVLTNFTDTYMVTKERHPPKTAHSTLIRK